jgi:cyclophilin family peptidyl-prolyl cis-trans isomerase
MTPENIDSERKRSRPVKKPNASDIIRRNKLLVSIIVIVIIIAAVATSLYVVLSNNKNNNNNSSSTNRFAVINTSLGTMKVELFEDKMPITTANFIRLANSGFYNNTIFHRIGANFMIQGGGYSTDGTQKTSPYGNIQFEESDVKHVNGAISIASTGAKVGGSAQYFICDGAQTFLDGNYAAFGVTVQGLDVVHTIATQPHADSGDGTGEPNTPIIVYSITIAKQ